MWYKTRCFIIALLIWWCSLATAGKRPNIKPTSEGDFECVNGKRYQENKCNICSCKNGELVGCSRSDCDQLPFYDIAQNCTVGNKWKEECNACSCVRQYGTVCTINSCATDTPTSSARKLKALRHNGKTSGLPKKSSVKNYKRL